MVVGGIRKVGSGGGSEAACIDGVVAGEESARLKAKPE